MTFAQVICDSISRDGIRLTTLQLRYPRMVHADFMTHRVFSRNGRSSRAVPVATLINEDAYVPHFMQNQPGMVASAEMSDEDRKAAEDIWLSMATFCKEGVRQLNQLKVHKQWANRPLEWFGHIDVLVTSTDWVNFFELRLDGSAQPEIIQLADCMKAAIDASEPSYTPHGAWHLPYVDIVTEVADACNYLDMQDAMWNENLTLEETGDAIYDVLKKISVARCARLTIKPFDGDGSIDKELARYEKLMISRPVHASPAEHIATPDTFYKGRWEHEHEHGNFYGWRQFRKMIPHNTIYDR